MNSLSESAGMAEVLLDANGSPPRSPKRSKPDEGLGWATGAVTVGGVWWLTLGRGAFRAADCWGALWACQISQKLL